MNIDDALRLLGTHQAGVLAQAELSRTLLAGEPDVVRPQLAKVRWTLSRLLRAYQLFKHVEIFDPAIRRGDAVQAATARRMKANCVAAGQDFADHVARWSAADVVGDWDRYRAATLAMIEDLGVHVARERRDVERLLAGAERTRRLARVRP